MGALDIGSLLFECRLLCVKIRQLNQLLDSVPDGWCGARVPTIQETVSFGCDPLSAAGDRVDYYNKLIDQANAYMSEMVLEIEHAFRDSPELERKVIMLYYTKAMTDQQIANMLKVNGKTRRATISDIRHEALSRVNILDAYVSSVL